MQADSKGAHTSVLGFLCYFHHPDIPGASAEEGHPVPEPYFSELEGADPAHPVTYPRDWAIQGHPTERQLASFLMTEFAV